MTDLRLIATGLAETYWKRPPVEAEIVAMTGEMERDSLKIAVQQPDGDNPFFSIEPAHYYALLREADKP